MSEASRPEWIECERVLAGMPPRSLPSKLSAVGCVLSVGHNSPEGVAHGHSYEVKVWYRFGHDARALQRQLEVLRQQFDHTVLPDELRFAENLAEHIAKQLPGCIEVEVNRPLERIYARWVA